MSYEIKSTRLDNETLFTVVEFTLSDATKVECDIPHFMPADKAAVLAGIANREVSEQAKHDAAVANEAIKAAIDADL